MMFAVILAFCLDAHICEYDVIDVNSEWLTIAECEADIELFVRDYDVSLPHGMRLYCEALRGVHER